MSDRAHQSHGRDVAKSWRFGVLCPFSGGETQVSRSLPPAADVMIFFDGAPWQDTVAASSRPFGFDATIYTVCQRPGSTALTADPLVALPGAGR